MSHYKRFNVNPFGKEDSGDCVVRAISLGTKTDYKKVCEMFNKKFKRGKGLDDQISIFDVRNFEKKYNTIKTVLFDKSFIEYVYQNGEYKKPAENRKLKEFCDKFSGKYILLLRTSEFDFKKEASREAVKYTFHAVYCDASDKKYYDIMKNDPGNMTIFWVYRVV